MTAQAAPTPSPLGTGWAFPPAFSPGGGEVEMVSGVEDVHQALRILFATNVGERPMLRAFGSELASLVFAPVSQSLITRLQSTVRSAIERFEPRVRLLEVEVTPDPQTPGTLTIRLDYEIPSVSSRFNMVFPFSSDEGSLLGR